MFDWLATCTKPLESIACVVPEYIEPSNLAFPASTHIAQFLVIVWFEPAVAAALIYKVAASLVVTDELVAAKVGASIFTWVYFAAVPEPEVLVSVTVAVSKCINAPSPGVTFLFPSTINPAEVIVPVVASSPSFTRKASSTFKVFVDKEIFVPAVKAVLDTAIAALAFTSASTITPEPIAVAPDEFIVTSPLTAVGL